MALQLTDALRDTRSLYAEASTAAFGDQQIRDWLSLGQQAVAALTLSVQYRARYLHSDADVFFLENVREYAYGSAVGNGGLGIPTIIRVLHCYLDGESLPLWTPKMVVTADPRAAAEGTPQYWYQFGPLIGFVPFPSTGFIASTWTLDVIYADLPADWTSGPSVLPGGLDELPTYFALTRMLLSRRQWQRAAQVYSQFLLLLQQYRQTTIFRNQTTGQEVHMPPVRQRPDTPRPATARELRLVQQGGR